MRPEREGCWNKIRLYCCCDFFIYPLNSCHCWACHGASSLFSVIENKPTTLNHYWHFNKNLTFKNRNLPRGESYSLSHTQCNPVKGEEDSIEREEENMSWRKHLSEHPHRSSNIPPPPNITTRKEGNKRNETADRKTDRWLLFLMENISSQLFHF